MASRQRPQLSQCGLHHVACVPEDVEYWQSDPSRALVPRIFMMQVNAEVILVGGIQEEEFVAHDESGCDVQDLRGRLTLSFA